MSELEYLAVLAIALFGFCCALLLIAMCIVGKAADDEVERELQELLEAERKRRVAR